MGRRRKKNKHLPERVYLDDHGTFRYYPKNGKPIPLARKGNYSAAMHAYAELDIARPGGLKMSEVFDRFTREVSGDYSRPADIRAQIARLRAVFGDMTPNALTTQHVYQYVDMRCQSSEAQALKEKSTLSAVMQKAIVWGYVQTNVVREFVGFTLESRDRRISDEEFDAVYNIAPESIKLAMDIGVQTGLRLGDILGLRLADCKDDGIHVTVGKSKRTQRTKKRSAAKKIIIAWSDELRAVIDRARDRDFVSPWVITNKQHKRYTVSGFESNWRRWRDNAKVKDFRFHDLRHKTATELANNKEAARLLAHSDPRITAKVYNNAPDVVQPLIRDKEK